MSRTVFHDDATGLIHFPTGNFRGLAPGFDPSVTFPADELGLDQEYIYGRTCHTTGDACADALAALEEAECCLLTNKRDGCDLLRPPCVPEDRRSRDRAERDVPAHPVPVGKACLRSLACRFLL